MPNDETAEVIRELRAFRDEIDAITNRVCGKSSVSREEKAELQDAFKSFKLRLKAAAKRQARNRAEFAYFDPAVRKASANLHIATNSHPITSDWCGALYSTRMDITFYLSQLERQFPE